MKSSLFKKQVILYMSILLITVVSLGIAFGYVFRQRYMSEKENQLITQAQKVAKQYILAVYMRVTSPAQFLSDFKTFEEYMGAEALLVDGNGVIRVASSEIDQAWVGRTLSNEGFEAVYKGEIVIGSGGRFDGIFTEPVLTVAYPIVAGNTFFGAIFMNASLPEIQNTISSVYMVTSACVMISLIPAFILIYISIKRISTPLVQINEAARVIANGNFEQRIAITGSDEVGQLAQSFNEMAKSLDEQEQKKRDFISNISHDIRTPLTSIQGFLTAILDGTIEKEAQTKYLEIVVDETGRLAKLTNDLIELNKAESGRDIQEFCVFEINGLIRKVLMQFESRAREKQLKIKALFAREVCFVYADREKIHRVLYNIVDNAVKFTDDEGMLEIETTMTTLSAVEGKKILVAVRDTGCGMTEEQQERVFDRFFKADNSRGMDKVGTGLGLSIVKEFIKSHNADLAVVSDLGRGTEISFTLNIYEQPVLEQRDDDMRLT